MVARRAHNPKVEGSNPSSAKKNLTVTFLRYIITLYLKTKPPSSRGLGHLPFTEETGIRIPLGVLSIINRVLVEFILYLFTKFNMTRVKRGFVARKRRKKVLKLAEGFRGASSVLFRTAKQQSMKALRYSYRDRKQRKRQFRSLWITRINAQTRTNGLTYSTFMASLRDNNIILNRKMLSQLAIKDSNAFNTLTNFK